jgi:DNA-binding NtrC family response regulator
MIDSRSETRSTSWTEPRNNSGMRSVLSAIQQIAASDFPVVIVGEKGTGKAWAARKIHELSSRSNGNFVHVDCITMDAESIQGDFFGSNWNEPSSQNVRENLFGKANGGTIFFDEIDALPLAAQEEIAQVLKSKSLPQTETSSFAPIDVRFVASLCPEPEVSTRGSVLCAGKYHRMSTITINLPPLRERREDIPHLIEEFLLQSSHRSGRAVLTINTEALNLCLKYAWPGNIQELKDAIEGAVMICRDGPIQKEHLPVQMQCTQHQHQWPIVLQENMNLNTVEKALVKRAVGQCRTKKEAAAMLGISTKTLYNKLNRYKLYERSNGESDASSNV